MFLAQCAFWLFVAGLALFMLAKVHEVAFSRVKAAGKRAGRIA